MVKKVNISEVKENPDNPRYIRDSKFKKLVKSIKEFPEMLEKRPIVVDENMVVLGGNMRLKACKSAGLFEVWIDKAVGWTEQQKREFVVKDNVGFGEWDWDILANDWNSNQLEDWGLDLWKEDEDYNGNENDTDVNYLENYLNNETGVFKISFDQDQYKNVVERFDKIMNKENLNNHSEVLIFLLENYECN